MAPEIIAGKGYSFDIDLWSLGIVLYEFMCGRVPCKNLLNISNKIDFKNYDKI
jgi:serine/threonine protein kinase